MRICYQSFIDEPNAAAYWQHLRLHLDRIKHPDTDIDIWGMTPHDAYAHPLVELRCAREMICNAVRAEREGYDAFIVGHFQDSGLYEARSCVDIPVVSLGEASMLYCCQLAQRIALVTINPRFVPGHRLQIARYGLGERVVEVGALEFEPGQIMEAFGSPEKTRDVLELFSRHAEPLVAAGAELILPAGGIPMLLCASERGFAVSGAPVANGIDIVLGMAEMAVRLRRQSGLEVSRRGTFVKAPPGIVDEYLRNPRRG